MPYILTAWNGNNSDESLKAAQKLGLIYEIDVDFLWGTLWRDLEKKINKTITSKWSSRPSLVENKITLLFGNEEDAILCRMVL